MIYEEIYRTLAKEIESVKITLASGGASDYHSYTNLVGRIQGLEYALVEIKSIVNKTIYEDDEE
jgi:hypothetical protein